MTSFMPTGQSTRVVKGEGPKHPKIALVGEAPGGWEERELRPFVGPAGGVLETCLHAAGLIRSEVYLTNVVDVRPHGPKGPNDISGYFDGKTFTQKGWEQVARLRAELDEVKPNVVVACGGTAFAALAGVNKITKYRGYVFATNGMQHVHKCIPTIHPAACLYEAKGGVMGSLATKEFKPYLYRHVIAIDLQKAKVESATNELLRPERQLVWDFSTVSEVLDWLGYYEKAELLSVDTEVTNYELACIGFADKSDTAISVPITGKWSLDDEVRIWRALQLVLGTSCSKVMQNGFFDVHFLATRCGLVVRGALQDTMIAHSIIWPEFPKGLGFLGSLYCGSQAYWKDMISFTNIKEHS